jgi:hypothetical protein
MSRREILDAVKIAIRERDFDALDRYIADLLKQGDTATVNRFINTLPLQ